MSSKRKNERWAGILYIIATVAPILAYMLIGFVGDPYSAEKTPIFLRLISEKENHLIVGMLIELIWALAVAFIPVSLFSALRKDNQTLAIGFLGLRSMESISVIAHSIILVFLMSLGQDYAAAGNPDLSHYQTAVRLLLAGREWIFLIGSGVIWTLSALLLNYQLYLSKLVPRWLSAWGLIGVGLSFIYYLPGFFSLEAAEIFIYPIALQEMIFAIWLISKGFNRSAVQSRSAA